MRIRFGTVLVGLVLLVAAGQLITVAPHESTAEKKLAFAGQCQNEGVSLVVDFGELSEKSIATCVSNFSGDGWEIFDAASIEISGTVEYPNAFMCRISDLPDAAREDCAGTPNPSSGYWKYFYSSFDSGESWIYSPIGAASREPKCGDVEGWLFVTEKNQDATGPSMMPRPIKC
jgi:hypothetical protein